ncbi:MAG: S8 family serine peptidase [Gemmatimonadaceae bacterium]
MSTTPQSTTILVKLRPSAALGATESAANLRPLYDGDQQSPGFGIAGEPQWFLAEMSAEAQSPWDLAHTRVADQLGVAESDVIFAEPDIIHDVYRDAAGDESSETLRVGANCAEEPQDKGNGKPAGPDSFAWHRGDDYSQLAKARDAVEFTEPRTRIAHLDTGYYPKHVTTPAHIRSDLQRSFASDDDSGAASDPGNHGFLDNAGHGTGTISVLAGGQVGGIYMGGAPDADIVPIRIADRVVLLRTSSFSRALRYALVNGCDVATMSMGGLPSRAWNDAINEAYLGGLCLVAAAGNNANGLPTRNLVYPARYRRVIAACGVMANGKPYTGLKGMKTLEGNFGPDSRMTAALATYTPNIPWAVFGCENTVRLNGEGTSAATPQIAAAAALWMEKYKSVLPRNWRRVEAVREALFSSAKAKRADRKRLGNGILQAYDALRVKPNLDLKQTGEDNDSFAFLRVLTGLGIVEIPAREGMFNLELAQRWLLNAELQSLVPDPDDVTSVSDSTLKKMMEAIIEDEGASLTLRRHIVSRYPVVTGGSAPRTVASSNVVTPVLPACDSEPVLHEPSHRRLRVYAVDPSYSTRLQTARINEVSLAIPWEKLEPGPVGEYIAVEDKDAAGTEYSPVNLDDYRLLAQDGWGPSEGNPQFHQQMVYAVAMKTIKHFESALGRPVLWRPGRGKNVSDDSTYVQRLKVHPHALRQANAYYSPANIALEFGYFETGSGGPGDQVPGSRVYSCLSHDIVAHETTHAVLDGMHPRFNEPTNPDVLALHEGFADIVALLQHFTIPEVLENEISRTRGDIEAESIFGSLAVQFGQATGGRGALRNAIGSREGGVWKRFTPDRTEFARRITPHSRGAILVAAVFDAFIGIYNQRTADLLRIYTGGTGILPTGAIHPDLAHRLADEAAKSAGHVLNMCIRALDYVPPVDVTFFEYLRAIITADFDLVSDDDHNYRVAFVEAFRRRGIYPENLSRPSPDTPRTLAVDTLIWHGINLAPLSTGKMKQHYESLLRGLEEFADDCLYVTDRRELFTKSRQQRISLHRQLTKAFKESLAFKEALGLDVDEAIEVHSVRCAMRFSPDGRHIPQVIVTLTQSVKIAADEEAGTPAHEFRGGSTLVVDLSVPEVKYSIRKNIDSTSRRARTAAFVREARADPLRALFVSPKRREPFAALHALADDGV